MQIKNRENRYCPKCGVEKTLQNTKAKPKNKNGLDAFCIPCNKQYKKEYYALHAEKMRANGRDWRKNALKEGKETGEGRYSPANIKVVNCFYTCRRYDRDRGFDNDLTMDFIRESQAQPCLYCGATEIVMTLDRIDNSKGHTMDNVNPACVRCNYFRKDMPYAAWIKLSPVLNEITKEGLFGKWVPGPKNTVGNKNA